MLISGIFSEIFSVNDIFLHMKVVNKKGKFTAQHLRIYDDAFAQM